MTAGFLYRLGVDIEYVSGSLENTILNEVYPQATGRFERAIKNDGSGYFFITWEYWSGYLDNVSVKEATPNCQLAFTCSGTLKGIGVLNSCTLGVQRMTNNSFDTDSDWTKDANWTIVDGNAVASTVVNTASIYQFDGWVEGDRYKRARVEIRVVEHTVGNLRARVGSSGNLLFFTEATGRHVGSRLLSSNPSFGTGLMGSDGYTGKTGWIAVWEQTVNCNLVFACSGTLKGKGSMKSYTLSAEVLTDPGFDNAPSWSVGAGWTLADSKVTGVAATGDVSNSSHGELEGEVLRIETVCSAFTSGVARWLFFGGDIGTHIDGPADIGSTIDIIRNTDTGNGTFGIQDVGAFTGALDSISIKKYENISTITFGSSVANLVDSAAGTSLTDGATTITFGSSTAVLKGRTLMHNLTLDSDIVINGSFDTDTDWNKGTGWAIDADEGKAVATNIAPYAAISQNTTGSPAAGDHWRSVLHVSEIDHLSQAAYIDVGFCSHYHVAAEMYQRNGIYPFHFHIISVPNDNILIRNGDNSDNISFKALSITLQKVTDVSCKLTFACSGTLKGKGEMHSFTLGAEEVTNGGFDADTDWNTDDAGWSISDGEAHAVATSGYIYQSDILVVGALYRSVFNVTEYTSGNGVRVGFGSTVLGASRAVVGRFVDHGYCSGTNTLYMDNDGTSTLSIDNVSLKEATPNCSFGFSCSGTLKGRGSLRANELGLEMLSESEFDTEVNWGHDSEWSIAAGKATYDYTGNGNLYQTGGIITDFLPNRSYKFDFEVAIASGNANLRMANGNQVVVFIPYANFSDGVHEVDVRTGDSIGIGGLSIRATTNGTSGFDLEYVSIKPYQRIEFHCSGTLKAKGRLNSYTFGSELITTGDFSSAGDWEVQANALWSIADGKASCSDVSAENSWIGKTSGVAIEPYKRYNFRTKIGDVGSTSETMINVDLAYSGFHAETVIGNAEINWTYPSGSGTQEAMMIYSIYYNCDEPFSIDDVSLREAVPNCTLVFAPTGTLTNVGISLQGSSSLTFSEAASLKGMGQLRSYTLSTEKIANGGMDSTSSWEITEGWEITGGVAVYDGILDYQSLYEVDSRLAIPLDADKRHVLLFDVIPIDTNFMRIRLRSGDGDFDILPAIYYYQKRYRINFPVPLLKEDGGIRFYMYNDGGVGHLDNVSLKSIIPTCQLAFTPAGTLTDVSIGEGPIDGATTITFSETASLKGRGSMSGVSTITFSEGAVLKAKGILQGTTSLTFNENAVWTATSHITGASTLEFTVAGDLSGGAAVYGSAGITFTTAAIWTAYAHITGVASITFTVAADISGTDYTDGTTSITFGSSAHITGRAQTTASSSITFSSAANLIGKGILTGTSGITFSLTAALKGRAMATGSTCITFVGIAAVTGTNYINGTTDLTFSRVN